MTSLFDIPSRPERVSQARIEPLNTPGPWPIECLAPGEIGRGDINVRAEEPEEPLFGTHIREAIRTLRGRD